jgi:uncharacterized membrane protein YbhN (UPF0104 family)
MMRTLKMIPTRKWIRQAIKISIFLIVFFFWWLYLRQNWDDLRGMRKNIPWGNAVLAIMITISGYFIFGSLWSLFQYEFTGRRMRLVEGYRISAIAWMGRYIPGRIWAIGGKTYLSTKDGTSYAQVGIAVVVETLWFEVSGIVLAVLLLPFCRGMESFTPQFILVSLLIIAAAVTGIHPSIFRPVVNRILAILHQPAMLRSPRYSRLLMFMVAHMGIFAIWSIGLMVFVRPLASVGWAYLPTIIAIYSVSWVAGFFSIITPAGLGVRDSLLAIGLEQIIPSSSVVIIVVVASRLMSTLAEMFAFLLAQVLRAESGSETG